MRTCDKYGSPVGQRISGEDCFQGRDCQSPPCLVLADHQTALVRLDEGIDEKIRRNNKFLS